MLQECVNAKEQPDYLIYGNRLFDPEKKFEDTTGIAYGGPDLSDRNLQVLSSFSTVNPLPVSATGNILSGEMAFRYLTHGATSFQMHTLFQLPDSEFTMQKGTRTERALHHLLFHPTTGFLRIFLATKEILSIRESITIEALNDLLQLAKQYSLQNSIKNSIQHSVEDSIIEN
jgi:hypothetical protein